MKAAHPELPSEDLWEKICVIDTENASGSLYVGTQAGGIRVGEYLTIGLEPPFSAARYLEAIDLAEQNGVEFLIIDSLSHAWSGEGGLLDVQANIAKRTGNGYTAWRDVTPQHNRLVDRILQCNMHIAATLRTKTEYVIEDNASGKKAPRKVGMAPVFREGFEYEMSVFFELALDHSASATKDRTGLFDGRYFIITPEIGTQIHQWLAGASTDGPAPAIAKSAPAAPPVPLKTLAEQVDEVMLAYCKDLTREEKEVVAAELKQIAGTANYRAVTDEAALERILERFGNNE